MVNILLHVVLGLLRYKYVMHSLYALSCALIRVKYGYNIMERNQLLFYINTLGIEIAKYLCSGLGIDWFTVVPPSLPRVIRLLNLEGHHLSKKVCKIRNYFMINCSGVRIFEILHFYFHVRN